MRNRVVGRRTILLLWGALIVAWMVALPGHTPASMAGAATSDQIKDKVSEALKHAKAAEDAGKEGKSEVLVKHAEMALAKAKDAQRAGHNERLNEGVYALSEAIEHGQKGETKDAGEHMMHAIMKLSQAADLQVPEGKKAMSPGGS